MPYQRGGHLTKFANDGSGGAANIQHHIQLPPGGASASIQLNFRFSRHSFKHLDAWFPAGHPFWHEYMNTGDPKTGHVSQQCLNLAAGGVREMLDLFCDGMDSAHNVFENLSKDERRTVTRNGIQIVYGRENGNIVIISISPTNPDGSPAYALSTGVSALSWTPVAFPHVAETREGHLVFPAKYDTEVDPSSAESRAAYLARDKTKRRGPQNANELFAEIKQQSKKAASAVKLAADKKHGAAVGSSLSSEPTLQEVMAAEKAAAAAKLAAAAAKGSSLSKKLPDKKKGESSPPSSGSGGGQLSCFDLMLGNQPGLFCPGANVKLDFGDESPSAKLVVHDVAGSTLDGVKLVFGDESPKSPGVKLVFGDESPKQPKAVSKLSPPSGKQFVPGQGMVTVSSGPPSGSKAVSKLSPLSGKFVPGQGVVNVPPGPHPGPPFGPPPGPPFGPPFGSKPSGPPPGPPPGPPSGPPSGAPSSGAFTRAQKRTRKHRKKTSTRSNSRPIRRTGRKRRA